MPKIIRYKTEAEWLALRREDVTSTETAALYGMSPYMSEFELWHWKKIGQAPEFQATARTQWGLRLEDAIAEGFAQEYGLKIRRINSYMRHDKAEQMGSSFDFEIVGALAGHDNEYTRAYREHGAGVLEIKNVDGLIYRKNWLAAEAPAHIEAQVQHQLEVINRSWAVICPLIGGNEIKPFIRWRDERTGAAICKRIAKFWASIACDAPPAVDYMRDAEFIISLHANTSGESVLVLDEASENGSEAARLCAEYEDAAGHEKTAQRRKAAAKAALLDIIGDDASAAMVGSAKISCGMTAASEGKLITPDMIGQYVGGRSGFRNFRVNIK